MRVVLIQSLRCSLLHDSSNKPDFSYDFGKVQTTHFKLHLPILGSNWPRSSLSSTHPSTTPIPLIKTFKMFKKKKKKHNRLTLNIHQLTWNFNTSKLFILRFLLAMMMKLHFACRCRNSSSSSKDCEGTIKNAYRKSKKKAANKILNLLNQH